MAFLFWLLSSSLKGVLNWVAATPLTHSPRVLNSCCIREHIVPHSIPPVRDPDQLEEAETPEEKRKRKIFSDLCKCHGWKLLFLECRPGVWHFYFTLAYINLSNLCIYSGYCLNAQSYLPILYISSHIGSLIFRLYLTSWVDFDKVLSGGFFVNPHFQTEPKINLGIRM